MPHASSVSHVELGFESQHFGSLTMSSAPRLTWRTTATAPDWLQRSAEVEITRASGVETASLEGGQSVRVRWPFAPLGPRESVEIRVRVAGANEDPAEWSAPLRLLAGHLEPGDWPAPWVRHPSPRQEACPVWLTGTADLSEGITSAMLYATAHGAYQVYLNGVAIDDEVLKPGWTVYGKRDTYAATDVTALLRSGANDVGVSLAGGWYSERYGFNGTEDIVYGDQPEFSGFVHVTYADGHSDVFSSDASWLATDDTPVRSAGIYAGEAFDSRIAPGEGIPVAVSDAAPAPVARVSPPVRRTMEVPVDNVVITPSGATILDFGQNLVGWLRIRVRGDAGDVITVRHAEVLENGELGVRPLRRAKATDSFVLAGGGEEEFEPQFTFHGFRFAEVTGWPGDIDPSAITAIVVHSDMPRTGTFECSDPLVTRLHENVVWSMRSNFLSIPTDCPQRDERMGWTGDIQVFAPTACFLFDSDSFLVSWLADLAVDQAPSGSIPFVVPDVLASREIPAAAWGDAATVVPWTLFQRFGNMQVLEAQFESMCAWTDHIAGRAGSRLLWEQDFQFGDWLDPDAPAARPAAAKVDPDIVATAHVFLSASLVSRAADVLGRDAEAERYAALADRVRDAWIAEYVTPAGRIMSDAPTAYALAIQFGIADDPKIRAAMGHRLAELVRRSGYRIGTGFVGTPIIQDALCSTGHADVAGRLLLQTENPAWLYPVTMGATTVWERWDSMLEDGSINPGEMTSFNHYALGAVADWLHRVVGGLAPAAPGYGAVRIAPTPIAGIDSAAVTLESPHGHIAVSWRARDGRIEVSATIPANATATVVLPGADHVLNVGSGSHTWDVEDPRVAAVPVAHGLDSPLSFIIDDLDAYRAVRDAFDATAPDVVGDYLRHVDWSERATLRSFAFVLPETVLGAIEVALDGLNRSRGVSSR